MNELQNKLDAIKKIEWNNAAVSFFIVKRTLTRRIAKYNIFHVNVDKALRERLRSIVLERLNKSDRVIEYDYITGDLDDNLLGLPTTDTDLHHILQTLESDEEPPTIAQYEELLHSWLYIARLDAEGCPPLFSARLVSKAWTTKKMNNVINLIFQNNTLVDYDQRKIFSIDDKVDFFTYDGYIFIADKKNFEIALNFREGMERKRDEIVEEFTELKLFEDPHVVSSEVGNNLHRLRKLIQVNKSGYYKNPNFLRNLRTVNKKDRWGIEYTHNGKIRVTKNNIETVLRVLNNDRLTSKINDENFDVDVKHKL